MSANLKTKAQELYAQALAKVQASASHLKDWYGKRQLVKSADRQVEDERIIAEILGRSAIGIDQLFALDKSNYLVTDADSLGKSVDHKVRSLLGNKSHVAHNTWVQYDASSVLDGWKSPFVLQLTIPYRSSVQHRDNFNPVETLEAKVSDVNEDPLLAHHAEHNATFQAGIATANTTNKELKGKYLALALNIRDACKRRDYDGFAEGIQTLVDQGMRFSESTINYTEAVANYRALRSAVKEVVALEKKHSKNLGINETHARELLTFLDEGLGYFARRRLKALATKGMQRENGVIKNPDYLAKLSYQP